MVQSLRASAQFYKSKCRGSGKDVLWNQEISGSSLLDELCWKQIWLSPFLLGRWLRSRKGGRGGESGHRLQSKLYHLDLRHKDRQGLLPPFFTVCISSMSLCTQNWFVISFLRAVCISNASAWQWLNTNHWHCVLLMNVNPVEFETELIYQLPKCFHHYHSFPNMYIDLYKSYTYYIHLCI